MPLSMPAYRRDLPQHHRLEGGKCSKCGKVFFPPRQVCNACGSRDSESYQLADTGKIITFTVVRTPPAGFTEITPYAIGIIEQDSGVRIMTQIVDCDLDDIAIGKTVKLEFRGISKDGETGIIQYGFKAVLE